MDDGDPQSPTIRAQTPPPPASASASASVTVAAASPKTLTLALPIQTPSPSNGGGGGRDDCWSEGATSALIDAWGERYLDLGRGSLKQKHWQEIADAVSARDDYTRPPKSDAQCKNRVDTLKKKYKSEKSKISSGQSQRSTWPFYHRLDILIGPNFLRPTPSPFPPQFFPQKTRTQTVVNTTIRKRPRSRSPPPPPPPPPPAAAAEDSDGDGILELTRAIVRFGELYERMELAKAKQAMEAEKQRMGFERETELQRMHFFIKAQMEISKLGLRRSKKNKRYDRRRHHRSSSDNGNGGGSNNSD